MSISGPAICILRKSESVLGCWLSVKNTCRSSRELSSVPGTHTGRLTTICDSSNREPDAVFWPQRALHTSGILTQRHVNKTLPLLVPLHPTKTECVCQPWRAHSLQLLLRAVEASSCLSFLRTSTFPHFSSWNAFIPPRPPHPSLQLFFVTELDAIECSLRTASI